MKLRSLRGFTLVELLVVIAIIGLLSTLAVVALNTARAKARDAKRVSDIKSIQKGLELYFTTQATTTYPVAAAAILGETGRKTLCSTSGFSDTCTGTSIMATVPDGPNPTDGGCASANYEYSSTTADYVTACAAEPCAGYKLSFCLGSQVGDVTGGVIHTATPAGVQ